MYTRKDELRGALIPVLIIGVPIGLIALDSALGLSPNVAGGTIIALLVGLVVWRVYVARHPERWPLPKKVVHALRQVGFNGTTVIGGGGSSVLDGTDDGFLIDYTDDPRVYAIMNEKSGELSFGYEARGESGSWLHRDPAFSVRVRPEEDYDHDAGCLVVDGKSSNLHVLATTPAEKGFSGWLGDTLGEQLVALPVSSLSVKSSEGTPWLHLTLTLEDGTLARVSEVISAAKDLFWKMKAATEAKQQPVEDAGAPFRGRSGA